MNRKLKVLVLGGGFGGVYVASNLGKLLTKNERQKVDVTIVNQENYLVFQPLLPEVISGSIELSRVITPIRRMAPHARLLSREVEAIDPVAKTVTLAPGTTRTAPLLEYDHLVIALGTRLDVSKVPGMAEHALGFKCCFPN